MTTADLSTTAESLLFQLIEAERDLPRAPWWATRIQRGTLITRPDRRVNLEAYWGDVLELGEAGLIRLERNPKGGGIFDILRAGYEHHAAPKTAASIEQVETETLRFLDGVGFRTRHPRAHAKWQAASRELWGDDAADRATTIGHHCREALQAFGMELVERHRPAGAIGEVNKDYANVKAVIDAHRDRLGERVSDMLVALVHFWGTATDLVQRQEHASHLTWEDSRRAVFVTAQVMYEVDRVLSTTRDKS